MKYGKSVEACFTMVCVKIYNLETDEQVGINHFSQNFSSLEKVFIKAHKWADKFIEDCEKYGVGDPRKANKK